MKKNKALKTVIVVFLGLTVVFAFAPFIFAPTPVPQHNVNTQQGQVLQNSTSSEKEQAPYPKLPGPSSL